MEFGSDFHMCYTAFEGKNDFMIAYPDVGMYASGRQALMALLIAEGWKRIWMPAYFCYEVINHIRQGGIEVCMYDDNPLQEDDERIVRSIPFEKEDVLLRVNYFGLRAIRTTLGIGVPVIEDHTHDLFSEWCLHSDADWCVASIRKSIPVAEGGILWSPKGRIFPKAKRCSNENVKLADMRYNAMDRKRKYLNGENKSGKKVFREKYLLSEEMIDRLSLSAIDEKSDKIFRNFNLKEWTQQRKCNWRLCSDYLSANTEWVVLQPEKDANPFSLILLCQSPMERSLLKQFLIRNEIYPAVLWAVPEDSPYDVARGISNRMLSLHCDGRYSESDMVEMCKIINEYGTNNRY